MNDKSNKPQGTEKGTSAQIVTEHLKGLVAIWPKNAHTIAYRIEDEVTGGYFTITVNRFQSDGTVFRPLCPDTDGAWKKTLEMTENSEKTGAQEQG